MEQIRSKLAIILLLILLLVIFIPSASSKYTTTYSIDLILKTVLPEGKLFWTDKTGNSFSSSSLDVIELSFATDSAFDSAGYYMFIAKGGNGADGLSVGGYGGIVAAIFEYEPKTSEKLKIALGTSGSTDGSYGCNVLDSTSTLGVLRGGEGSTSISPGGGGTLLLLGDDKLLLLAGAGGGGGSPSDSSDCSGGSGGGNIITFGTAVTTTRVASGICYPGRAGYSSGMHSVVNGGIPGGEKGLSLEEKKYPEEGIIFWDDFTEGHGGEGCDEYLGLTGSGGAGYTGGGGGINRSNGGGSSFIANDNGFIRNATLDEYTAAMTELISKDETLSDLVDLGTDGRLYDKGTTTLSPITFVGIYYMGTSVS